MLMTRLQYLFGLAFTGAMALAGGFAATLVMQPGAPVHAQEGDALAAVKTSELQLVDSKGVVRAKLGLTKSNATVLSMFDEKGVEKLQAVAEADGAGLRLVEGDARTRYMVHFDSEKNQTAESIFDSKGNLRVLTSLQKDEMGLIAFNDAEGRQKLSLLSGDEFSSLQLYRGGNTVQATAREDGIALFGIQHGKTVRYRIGTNAKGAPEMIFNDSKGDWGIVAALTEDNRPVFALAKDGGIRLRALAGADGTPTLEMLDKQQKTTWKAGPDPKETTPNPDKPDKPESE
jgi:hypothetical protein